MRRALASLVCASLSFAALPQAVRAGEFDSRGFGLRDFQHSGIRAMGLVEIPLGGRSGVWNAPRLGIDVGPTALGSGLRSQRVALVDATFGEDFQLRLRGRPMLGSVEGSWENALESFESCFFGAESLSNPQCWAAYVVVAGIIGGGIVGGMCAAEAAGLCDDDGTGTIVNPGGGSPGLGSGASVTVSASPVNLPLPVNLHLERVNLHLEPVNYSYSGASFEAVSYGGASFEAVHLTVPPQVAQVNGAQ